MNILIINHYAGSPAHGMEFRPYYLAQEWLRKGHQVMIVGSSYSHVRNIQPITTQLITTEIIDGITYVWLRTAPYHGNGVKRVLNIFEFVFKLLLYKNKLLKTFIPDVVIASSTYPLDVLPAKAIARKYKIKLVFELHDLWPLSPMEIGGMSPTHPFIMLMQWAENKMYTSADKVISILPDTYEHMKLKGVKQTNFTHVPNGIVLDDWQHPQVADERLIRQIQAQKKENKLLIAYLGTHGAANALNYLIDAAALVKELPVHFFMIGDGPEKSALQEQAASLALENLTFLNSVPKRSVPSLLKEFDVLYIGWHKRNLYRYGISPNKIFDYMMAAKPILHSFEFKNDIITLSGGGIRCDAEDAHQIAETIKRFASLSPQERNNMGQQGYLYVNKNHTYATLADNFLKAIQ